MDKSLEQYRERLGSSIKGISKIDHPIIRRDLLRMVQVVEKLLVELSKESVECRRNKRITGKYSEIARSVEQQLSVIDKWLLVGLLRSSGE